MNRETLAEFHLDSDGKIELIGVVVAEFHGKGPHGYSLKRYDVDLSKAYGYVYHMSGGGGSMPEPVDGLYCRTAGFRVKERPSQLCAMGEDGEIDKATTKYLRMRNRTRRLIQLPREFRKSAVSYSTAGDILDWLERNAIQDETVWCSTCKDHLPGESLCQHCWWCDTVGWYVTPDEGKVCFDPDCFDCRNHRRIKHEAYRTRKRRERYAAEWAARKEVAG